MKNHISFLIKNITPRSLKDGIRVFEFASLFPRFAKNCKPYDICMKSESTRVQGLAYLKGLCVFQRGYLGRKELWIS